MKVFLKILCIQRTGTCSGRLTKGETRPASQHLPRTRAASGPDRTLALGVVVTALVLAGCGTRTSALVIREAAVVEAACGECKFGMQGDDCDLAIRVGGQSYFVDGVNADSLGDAHAVDGICEAIRSARVTGEVKFDRFVATSFQLLPAHSP